jgi:hypothetical protein
MTKPKYPNDLQLNQQYKDWVRFVCQCRHRNEDCSISWNEYQKIWKDRYHLRGRGGQDLVLTRIDHEGAWTENNIQVITRREQIQRKNIIVTAWRRSQGLKYQRQNARS